jgi:hypothetical protein
MRMDPETKRIVQSWLEEGRTALPDHILDAVLDQLPATRQRRPLWPARRIVEMNTFSRLSIAAAGGVVVTLVAINLFAPSNGVGGGGPTISPLHAPSPTSESNPSPSLAGVNPNSADFTIGSHSLTVDGVPFSFIVPNGGWEPFSSFFMSKSFRGPQGAEALIFWATFPGGALAESCDLDTPPNGRSAADLATAVSTAPGTELVTGPSDVTVGGRAAKHIVVTVREKLGCDPGFFYHWKAKMGGALWLTSDVGDTIRVWIVDVDGTRLFIGGETRKGSGSGPGEEIDQIVGSIRFE